MASTPFAFSIHHFINSVGAYAGFAAIIGLAILVLLFFAQARETHNLRQQASEADERVAQMESRLAWVTRQRSGATDATAQFPAPTRAAPAAAATGAAPPPTPTPTPAFAGATAAAPGRSAGGPAAAPGRSAGVAAAAPGRSAGVAAAAPGPPAGVAAPALAAATRLIPAVSAPSQLASPAAAAVAPPPTRSAPLASPPPRPAPGPASAYTAPPGDGATLAAPPSPATEAGGGNGEVRDRVYGAAPAPVLPPPAQPEAGRSWVGRVVAVFLGALVIAGIVVALLIVTSNNGTTSATSSAHATNASAAHRARRSPTFRPSSVTVAVLNGTGVAGLARRVATRLGTGGYKQGTVANASDQTNTATSVAYLPGHRADAVRVASSLKLGSGAVQPVDASTQQIACPPGMTCAADVVVTVGTDLASQ